MCLASPVKIIKILGKTAEVEDSHGKKLVRLDLIKKPKVNDYLLAHGDLAISKLNREEAKEIINLNSQLAANYQGKFVGKVAAPPH